MDVSRDRMLRRFDTKLRRNLQDIDVKMKIFTKNHKFKNRLIKKDLRQIIDSGRKMASGDLDAWDIKRTNKTNRDNEQFENILSALTPKTPKGKIVKIFEDIRLPDIALKKSNESSLNTARESIVLPPLSSNRQTTRSDQGKSILRKSFSLSEQSKSKAQSVAEVPNQTLKSSRTKTMRSKQASKTVTNKPKKTHNTDDVVSKDRRSHKSEKTSDNQSNESRQTSGSNQGSIERSGTVSDKWRRLSVVSFANLNRCQTIKRRSMTADQAVFEFLRVLSDKLKIKDVEKSEDDQKYDLSYLKNCRYLRASIDNDSSD